MRNRIDIDHIHCRAIIREIGERLRASLKPESKLPASLESANRSAPRIRSGRALEQGARLSRSLGRTWMNDAAGEASCIDDLE